MQCTLHCRLKGVAYLTSRRNVRPTVPTLASTNKTLEEFKKAEKSAVAVKRLHLEAVEIELAALARSIVDS